MEDMLSQTVIPLLKGIVLFLFIFTTKVLTTKPQEISDDKNSIHHPKPLHYVRTFTKYHHRRTNQWNHPQDSGSYWSVVQDHQKHVGKASDTGHKPEAHNWPYRNPQNNIRAKRSLDIIHEPYIRNWRVKQEKTVQKRNSNIPHSNELLNSSDNEELQHLGSNIVKSTTVAPVEVTTVKKATELVKNVTVVEKKEVLPFCLYNAKSVGMSVTPSYKDDKNAQFVSENVNYDAGVLSEMVLPDGSVAQVEECTDPKASCYTLYHKDSDDGVTILGQGCWRAGGPSSACGTCSRANELLPGSRFCCCSGNYCNGDFLSLKETVIVPAQSARSSPPKPDYIKLSIAGALAILAALVVAVVFRRVFCKGGKGRAGAEEEGEKEGDEKADVMGSGPDALATGLSCVDNLTLIEHIGQGKFGSVWRGTLGSTQVAVKLYANATTWQKETAIYSLPRLAHPNILKYYGSDTRPALTSGSRSHLIVLELCSQTLQQRLRRAPLSWQQFAEFARQLASAVAHLHSSTGGKPCIVHRDINSNNVLVTAGEAIRLADFGLARHQLARAQTTSLHEAGTLRYLAPEALEGALDLTFAGAALCAVDVYAVSLVLWEMLYRTQGAHAGHAPGYAAPYEHHGVRTPTLAQMQSLVCRNKARPPLPLGPGSDPRALKLACDTCEECWDHDAEARLTAVCVEERMSELVQMLTSHGPVIHDNNLHPHLPDSSIQQEDKNSNCTSTQTCDVTTPLLFPHPHIGRNACIERNTLHTQPHPVQLIHKSLKDITAPTDAPRVENIQENCLSVARITHSRVINENSDRLNEIRSYQRPLDYVPNDVSSHEIERGPKETNLLQVQKEKPKWNIKKFFERRLNRNSKLETEVKLVDETGSASVHNKTKTSLVGEKVKNFDRPANLVLTPTDTYNYEAPCTLSPPNRTLSPTMMLESELNRADKVFGFKELPRDDSRQNQIFAVIVPKAKPTDYVNVEMRSKTRGSSESIDKSVRTSRSSQSLFKSGHSESEDSTVKKRLSADRVITNSNSGRSSRASINLELQYIDNNTDNFNDSPFDLNSDCSSSEDEHLMLLSENGGAKITMQPIPKIAEIDKKKYQNDVLKESSQPKAIGFNFQNKYANFDNEVSDPNDKENLNGYSGDNPVYLAALNGEIDTDEFKFIANDTEEVELPKSPKPPLKALAIKRQHSLEQVSEIFSSSGDINLLNPAGRVKTPGDLPVAIRKARRDRALQKGRANEANRLSLYDDRMMFGNSL